jgi:hypothetical protein
MHNFQINVLIQFFVPFNRNSTEIKLIKEEMKLLNLGIQYNIKKLLTTYSTNLIIEYDKAIKLLDTKSQNAFRILATKQLKQILNSSNSSNILYIKLKVCSFVCLFVPYTNPHFWTNLNHTLHTSPPWSGRDPRICMDPQYFDLFDLFFRERVPNPGQKMAAGASHPRQRYIRDCSTC